MVIDNESTDATAAIASKYTDVVLTAPRKTQYDSLQNLAIEHSTSDWIFVLDADERVPARHGPMLRQMISDYGH